MYLFKVNNRNSRKRYEICSMLTTKTPQHRQGRFGGFTANFECISQLFLKWYLGYIYCSFQKYCIYLPWTTFSSSFFGCVEYFFSWTFVKTSCGEQNADFKVGKISRMSFFGSFWIFLPWIIVPVEDSRETIPLKGSKWNSILIKVRFSFNSLPN